MKRKTQTMAAPLRAKVLRLSQQCKARDELIRRLSTTLQRYERDSDVVQAADKVVQASTDYSRPISPLTSQFLTDLEVKWLTVTILLAVDFLHVEHFVTCVFFFFLERSEVGAPVPPLPPPQRSLALASQRK